MKTKIERRLVKIVIIGLLGLVFIIVYQSFTKEIIETKEPIVVYENMQDFEHVDDDRPLQIVAQEEIDYIKGLNEFIGVTGDNEIIARVGLDLSKEQIKELFNKSIGEKERKKLIDEARGQLYKIDLTTLEKTPLKTDGAEFNYSEGSPTLSPNGSKLMHIPFIGNEPETFDKLAIVFDVNNKFITNINANIYPNIDPKDVIYRNWSQDSRYIVGPLLTDEFSNIVMLEVENNKFKEIKIRDKEVKIHAGYNMFTDDGKYIFFKGSKNNIQGIYKLNVDSGDVEITMFLRNETEPNSLENYMVNRPYKVIDDGKRIVFVGVIKGEPGLYIYDNDSKEYTNVVKNGENHPGIDFWISPDSRKVIYTMLYKNEKNRYLWNVYAAKIVGNKLENTMMISQDIEYPGVPDVQWSKDSKQVFIFEPTIFEFKSGRFYNGKGIIRKIRFK